MKMKRIAAGLLSFILLMGNSMTVFATEADTVTTAVSGNEVVSENDEEISAQIVSDIPLEYAEIAEEAKADLETYLEEKDIFAIVYLTDSYAVKAEPSAEADTVMSVPSARTVQILGMDVAWEYWEEWEEYVPTVWYETQFYEGETLYSGYIEESYLAYSDELLLEWKNNWYMLFPMSNSMYAAESDPYTDVKQFPTSYQSALKKLKDAHPNWTFVPMNVNRDWNACVTEQIGDYSWIYYDQPAEYRGTQINSKWYYASRAGIEYYMDPRNFLTEANIFQFEQNTYNSSYHTQEALQSFLSNTFMKGVVPDDSQGRTYAKVIFDSGKSRGLSPFNLAARVIQEQGVNGTSPMISGTYAGYEGYYNHYNISASGSTNEAVYKSGLTYAKNKGWNTRVKSLEGGAAFIGNGYILQGQDTLYLQKFDVEHGSGSIHQYMQNIMAPYSEGRSMKTMYTNAGSLNSAFVFKIPVYNNMPNEYKFTISTTSVTLHRGVEGKETHTLTVKCNGEAVADGTVTFKSGNDKVAKVSSSGVITAVGSGETTISISVKYDDMEETQEFECAVKVLSPLQGISLNIEEQELFLEGNLPDKVAYLDENGVTQYKYADKGEIPTQVTLEVSYDPADTTDSRAVTWTVKDENIVSIEKQGEYDEQAVITAKNNGSTTVTAKVGNYTKTAVITVRVPMTEAKLSQNELTMYKGESTQITATYLPHTTSDRIEPIWTSEDETVAAVEDGKIIAKGAGTTTLHAAIGPFDGSQAELTVQVTVAEYEVTFKDAEGNDLLTATGEYGKSLENLVTGEDSEIPWTIEKEGYYFVGWYTEENGGGKIVTPNTILYGNMTLYPYFIEEESAEIYVQPVGSVTYTGAYMKPDVKVYNKDILLTKDVDYTLSYKNNKAVNDGSDPDKMPTIIITGKGQYAGWEAIETFVIAPKNISNIDVTAKNLSADYTGNVQKLRPTISDNGRTLQNNIDYTLEYTDTADGAYKEAGTYAVKITGIGNYTGERYVYITITKRVMMEDVSVSVPSTVKYNNGKTYASAYEIEECKPEVTVKYNGNVLRENTDYTLSYSNNTEIGTASVTITGQGSYIGKRTASFKIVGTDMSTMSVSGISDKEYTGNAVTQSNLTVTDKNKETLREGLDYNISYKNNTETGKASVIFTGIHGYSGSLTKTFTIEPYDIAKNELTYDMEVSTEGNTTHETRKAFEISLVSESVEYDKAGAEPSITVTFKGNILTEGTDYKVSYQNNNRVTNEQTEEKPAVVITGKGLFTGTVTEQFTITSKDISKVSMTANDVKFRNRIGFCFVEPVLKDISGRRLKAGTDYLDELTYTYVEETWLYDGTRKAAGSVVSENDIPIVKDGKEPSIQVTATGIGNYTGTVSCTYKILENTSFFEQVFSNEPEKSENTNAENIQNVQQTTPVESTKTTVVSLQSSTFKLNSADGTTQAGVELYVENGTLLPDKTVVTCENSAVADCFSTKIEDQKLYIQLDKEKEEQVPDGDYAFRITPVVSVDGVEITMEEQVVTVTVAKKLQEIAGASAEASAISQVKQEKDSITEEAVAAMADPAEDLKELEEAGNVLSVDEAAGLEEKNPDDQNERAAGSKNSGAAAAAAVAATVCLAATGGVVGIRFYRKKKADDYFFDEEDDLLD